MPVVGYYNFIEIIDGIPVFEGGGGGVTLPEVKSEIGKSISDRLIQVSPDFSTSDTYGEYPTMGQGLSRANSLATSYGEPWEVVARAGEYAEENLLIGDKVTLRGEKSSILKGVASPTAGNPIVEMNGDSRLLNMYFRPQGDNPTGSIIKVNNTSIGDYPIISGVTVIALVESVDWHSVLEVSELGVGVVLVCLNSSLVFYNPSNIDYIIKVIGNSVGFYLNNALIGYDADALYYHSNGSLGSFQTLYTINGGLLLDPVGNLPVQTGSYIGGEVSNCSGAYEEFSIGAGIDSIGLTPSGSMEQEQYPQSGASKGTVRDALINIKSNAIFTQNQADNNSANIAIMAANMDFKLAEAGGEFQGMLVEDFSDSTDIDATPSNLYTIEGGFAKSEVEVTEDDFESYADTTALRAVWVPSDAIQSPNTLEVGGAYEGSKWMECVYNGVPSNNDSWLRTYASNQDWSTFKKFSLALKVLSTNPFVPLTFILYDADGRQAYIPQDDYGVGDWRLLEFDFSQFAIDPGFKFFAVKQVRIRLGITAGITGSFGVDLITREYTGKNSGRTVDAMDSTTGWAGTGISIGVGTSNPREGSGYITFTVPVGAFSLTRTWPGSGTYANILSTDSAFVIWGRARNVVSPGFINTGELELTDENSQVIAAKCTKEIVGEKVWESTDVEWDKLIFYMTDMGRRAGSSPFDFSKIVKAKFTFVGSGGTWDWDLDFFEAGDLSRIQSKTLEIGEDFNQVKIFCPNSAETRFMIDLVATVVETDPFDWNHEAGFAGSTQFGLRSDDFGDWLDLEWVGSTKGVRYRILSEDKNLYDGVSILWRNI